MNKLMCKCGGEFRKDSTYFENFLVECMKCSKCGHISFTPEQTKEIIRLKELSKELETHRKVCKISSHSIGIVLPKKLEQHGVKVGSETKIKVISPNALEIIFEEDFI